MFQQTQFGGYPNQNNGFNQQPMQNQGYGMNNQPTFNFNTPQQNFTPGYKSGNEQAISNFTSAKDPRSVHSRIFVGNLNTFELSKEAVRNIFARYGHVEAISKHKGYAFVQFNDVFEARKAVAGEDGQFYAGMKIDCNIVAEPKNKQGIKRLAPRNNDSYGGRQAVGSSGRQLVTLGGDEPSPKQIKTTPKEEETISSNSSPNDILICGRCKLQFTSVYQLSLHKDRGCQLKFACKCKEFALRQEQEPSSFTCATCSDEFSSSWDLCVHCQHEHGLSIYKESGQNGTTDTENDDDTVLNLESDEVEDKVTQDLDD